MTSRYRALIRSRSFESVFNRLAVCVCSSAIRMPKERPKSRKERRQLKKANYLSGQARDPYLHSPTLGAEQEPSDTGAGTSSGTSVLPTPTSGVCPRCLPVLSKYQVTFEELTHRGSSSGHSASELAIPQAALSYSSSGLIKEITSTKRAHLEQMYKNFIDS